jgi:hypothetical protein
MINMSSSAISGLSGIVSAPLDAIFAAVQPSAKPQATTAPPDPAANGAQRILLVPTKPPLSAAVMAVLIGRQTSSDSFSMGGYASNQRPADGATTAGNRQAIPPSG